MMSFKEATIKVLEEVKTPLNVSQIMERILERKYLKPQGVTPLSTLSGQLNTDIKKENSRFVKVGKGYFFLNPNFKEIKEEKPKKQKKERWEEKTVILCGQKVKFSGLV